MLVGDRIERLLVRGRLAGRRLHQRRQLQLLEQQRAYLFRRIQVEGAPGQFGGALLQFQHPPRQRSEEHTSELQSLMRISYAVFCLKKKNYEKQCQIHLQPLRKQPTTDWDKHNQQEMKRIYTRQQASTHITINS